MIAVLPVRVKQKTTGTPHVMEGFGEFVVTRRQVLMWGMAGIIVQLFIEFYLRILMRLFLLAF